MIRYPTDRFASASARHCEREPKQSSPAVIERHPDVQQKHGLLRFARNDGGRTIQPENV
jgi:hypothetical protein